VSFWERNRGLLVGLVAAAVGGLVIHFMVAGSRRSQAQGVEAQNAGLEGEIARLNELKNKPAPEAIKELKAERADLQKVLKRLEGMLLVQPREYVLPKNEAYPRLFFDKRLNELRKRCADQGGRFVGKPCPAGFTDQLQKEDVELLLQRLSAARLLTEAAENAKVAQVQGLVHGRPALLTAPGVDRFHLRLLPINVRFVADERQLIAFVQEISREGRFLTLQNLSVEVIDPKAKTFQASADLMALVRRDGSGSAKKPEGPVPGTRPLPPAGRW